MNRNKSGWGMDGVVSCLAAVLVCEQREEIDGSGAAAGTPRSGAILYFTINSINIICVVLYTLVAWSDLKVFVACRCTLEAGIIREAFI